MQKDGTARPSRPHRSALPLSALCFRFADAFPLSVVCFPLFVFLCLCSLFRCPCFSLFVFVIHLFPPIRSRFRFACHAPPSSRAYEIQPCFRWMLPLLVGAFLCMSLFKRTICWYELAQSITNKAPASKGRSPCRCSGCQASEAPTKSNHALACVYVQIQIYIYIYMYICMRVYTHIIYIYIYTQRERDRQIDRQIHTHTHIYIVLGI